MRSGGRGREKFFKSRLTRAGEDPNVPLYLSKSRKKCCKVASGELVFY